MRCIVCGCTDFRACPQGCSWIADEICSACLDFAPDWLRDVVGNDSRYDDVEHGLEVVTHVIFEFFIAQMYEPDEDPELDDVRDVIAAVLKLERARLVRKYGRGRVDDRDMDADVSRELDAERLTKRTTSSLSPGHSVGGSR